ncbi:MAG: protein translocase subunit SecF [Candidatus Aenigmatarchaeota archaeon]|nr:MAG: protein translocase subunit SecF [Candidatus Aenigmarchaeota archaeon]
MKNKKHEKPEGKRSRIGAHRTFLIIPIVLLIASAAILVTGFMQTGEWFTRSIELKGGTLISVTTPNPVNIPDLENSLSKFGSVIVRELRSYSGYGVSIEVEADVDADIVLEELRGMGIDTKDYSIETIGPALGESFWIQAQYGIIIAFILMGIIVFVVFRTFIPSIAVMLCAVSDIIITIALMQLLGLSLSLTSFAALLMLIGYSIDTDILLTTRLIKVTDKVIGERMIGAFKTGITMTGTTLGVLIALLLTTTSSVLFQIASVLTIGLVIDIVNTWFQNATLLRWHCERRGLV